MYHQYSCMSEKITAWLLRFDMMGIGMQIFGLVLGMLWSIYYAHPDQQLAFTGSEALMAALNLGFQLTPCYTRPSWEIPRTIVLCLCFGLFVVYFLLWVFEYGSDEDKGFLTNVMWQGCACIGTGFLFFVSQWPERSF